MIERTRHSERKTESFFKKPLVVALLLGFCAFAGAGAWVVSLVASLPNPDTIAAHVVSQSTKIWDRTGTVLLYEISGEERRTVIPFSDMTDTVRKATLAAEDDSFYQHPAYDIRAMIRGVIINPLLRGTTIQGGSTITQQLVKNVFLTDQRTIVRKIKEIALAVKLEQIMSKDQILTLYLNQIPYGSNTYGIEAASQTFFEKHAKDLDLAQAALLAALPNAPSRLSPYGVHTDEMKQRQEYILDRMAQLGWITQQQADQAKAEPLAFAKVRYGIKAPHFVFYVRSLLDSIYDDSYIQTSGLNIVTSLDWNLEQIAEKAVADGAARNDVNWHADNAALVAQDPKTGEILAMAGSRDYFDTAHNGNVNVALQTRQPGSSFKPFVYLKAFSMGYTPDTILFDTSTEFNARCNADGTPGPGMQPSDCYHPTNYDMQFRGPVSLRTSIAQSLNIPSVKLLYLVGIDKAIQVAQSFGITTLNKDPQYYGLPLILGGGGVRLLDMVGAYSVFSQEGTLHPQVSILKITDASGATVYQSNTQPQQVFDSQYVRVLNDVLSDDKSRYPTFQLNGPLTVPGYDVAAKTGTSQDYRDAWTIGYSPTLVAGVWVGNNDYSPMHKGGAGGLAAAPIWNDFMKQALPQFPNESFAPDQYTDSQKTMLDGHYVGQTPSGPQIHSILYWVNKDDPLGAPPQDSTTDPQYQHWEYGIQTWLSEHASSLDLSQAFSQISASPILQPGIKFLEPSASMILHGGASLKVSFTVQQQNTGRVDLSFNGQQIISFTPSPDNTYSLFFAPQNIQQVNTVLVTAYDAQNKPVQASLTLQGQP